jgi:hypothetical protein
MLHVSDDRLIRLIILGKKTAHRFPATYRRTGEITIPKIAPGRVHKVYKRAPFGSDGNPKERPLAEVMIEEVTSDVLGDVTLEEARLEGFCSIEAFQIWWNRRWYHKGLNTKNHKIYPVWVIRFSLVKVLPAGKRLMRRLDEGED